MKRLGLSFLAVAVIVGCSPRVPDSASGVGFDSYEDYQSERRARDRVLSQGSTGVRASDTVRPPSEGEDQGAVVTTPLDPQGVPAEQLADNPSISDEQDFQAVSNRESIESDAERLRARRENYTQITPTAVPSRRGRSGPNIVDFALSTTHMPGQKVYDRSNTRRESNCGDYTSSDLAQEAFLKAGGPERDKLRLDPDGDGFACGWDPRPFRNAAR